MISDDWHRHYDIGKRRERTSRQAHVDHTRRLIKNASADNHCRSAAIKDILTAFIRWRHGSRRRPATNVNKAMTDGQLTVGHTNKYHISPLYCRTNSITRGQSDLAKAARNDPAHTARAAESSRVTDTAIVGINSLHLMHSTPGPH